MKKIIILLLILISFLACEKDNICIEETTPYLIIRFYDFDSPDFTKQVVNIIVEIEGIEGNYENETTIKQLTDSIAIPLKVTDDMTQYKITASRFDENDVLIENQDRLEILYDRENIYVSRSCGYKTVYQDAALNHEDDGNNWIQVIETTISPLNIIDQTSAHVKIYH